MQIIYTDRLEDLKAFLFAVTFSEVKISDVDDTGGATGGPVPFVCTSSSFNALVLPQKDRDREQNSRCRLHIAVNNLQSSVLAALMTGQKWEEVGKYEEVEKVHSLVLVQGLDGIQIALCCQNEEEKSYTNNAQSMDWFGRLIYRWMQSNEYVDIGSSTAKDKAKLSSISTFSPIQTSIPSVGDVYADICSKQRRERGRTESSASAYEDPYHTEIYPLPSPPQTAYGNSASSSSSGNKGSMRTTPPSNTSSSNNAADTDKADRPATPSALLEHTPTVTPKILQQEVPLQELRPQTTDLKTDLTTLPPVPFYATVLSDGQWNPIPPNSRSPVAFQTEYFDGQALLLTRTLDDPEELQASSHPYKEFFAGKGFKYQFEVQVQGKFRQKVDKEKDGYLFMGAELDKKVGILINFGGYISMPLLSYSEY